MRAIRFEAFGDPSVLALASINPSDVKNVAGAMKQTTLPRIPGRDFAGVVEAGPEEWIGAQVWGTGGDMRFTRDGSHAEFIVVPAASLRRKPDTLSFDQAASVAVNYVAAWCGIEAAGLTAEETVLLIGAGGGVGSAAAQIARRLGASVIGVDRRAPHPELIDFYRNEGRLVGVDTLKRDVTASAKMLDALTPGLADYRASPIVEICGLGEAREAYPQGRCRRSRADRAAAAGIGEGTLT